MNNEKIKDNSFLIAIGVLLFSAGGLFYVSYDTANSAKLKTEALELRMTASETKAARFEGIMNERTRNIQDNVKTINENVMKLLENLELAEGSYDGKGKTKS